MTGHGGHRPGAGRKPAGDPRAAKLDMRLAPAKLSAYREAATRAGMTLTDWVELHLDAAASAPPREQGGEQ